MMSIRERNKTTFNNTTHFKHGDEFINFENVIKKQKEEQNSKIIQSEQNLSCHEYLLRLNTFVNSFQNVKVCALRYKNRKFSSFFF